MKVLMITSYVTNLSRPEFSRNVTGFGYMVRDIAEGVAKFSHVDVLCTDSRGEAFHEKNVHYLKRSFILFIVNALKCLPFKSFLSLLKKYNMPFGTSIRVFYYWLMTGFLSDIIKKGGYDIIHLHGCDYSTDLWIKVCKKCNVRFIVTLHGLNSFSDNIKIDSSEKQYERDFLNDVVIGALNITVISSGMKRMIEDSFEIANRRNIYVVCNSFSFQRNNDNSHLDIRSHYSLPKTAKLLLYVGNISANKNQSQMVRAFNLLPDDVQKNTYVLFCGAIHDETVNLEKQIRCNSYPDHLILCGSVKREHMVSYYEEADGVVLLSFSEGFGLSLIEGMHFGLPCIMHKDLDAFEDIYNEIGAVGIQDRNDDSVAQALNQLLSRKWDKDAIKSYSEKFGKDAMARKYIDTYSNVIRNELF